MTTQAVKWCLLLWMLSCSTVGLCPSEVVAQQSASDLPVRIVVYQKGGPVINGYAVSIDDQRLEILSDRVVAIDRSSIERVRLLPLPYEQSGYLMGMLVGAHIGALHGSAAYQPYGYFDNNVNASKTTFWACVGLVGGSFLGYVIEGLIRPEPTEIAVFDFAGSDSDIVWRKLSTIIHRAEKSLPIRLQFYSGFLDPSMQHDLDPYVAMHRPRLDFHREVRGAFNSLRRIELSFDLWYPTPEQSVQVGLSFVQMGEPRSLWTTDTGSYPGDMFSQLLTQSSGVEGYFVQGAYNVHLGQARTGFDMVAGVGLGFANVSYERLYSTRFIDQERNLYSGTSTPFAFKSSPPAGLLFFGARANMTRSFSLGLYADMTLVPKQSVDAFPELGIPEQSMQFGNNSYGFTAGFQF